MVVLLEETKVCKDCGIKKPLNKFKSRSRSCRACTSKREYQKRKETDKTLEFKKCCHCKITKDIKDFNLGSPLCRACRSISDKNTRQKRVEIQSKLDSLECSKCKITKDIKEFRKGYLVCKECHNVDVRKAYRKRVDFNSVLESKKCPKCLEIKDIGDFNKGGHTCKTCTKLTNKKSRNQRKRTPKGALRHLLVSCRSRAKKEGYEIDFDLDYLLDLYKKQSGCCAATGNPFDFSDDLKGKQAARPFCVSIDRLDPNGRYLRANIRLVNVAFNVGRQAYPDEVFERNAVGFLKKEGYEVTSPNSTLEEINSTIKRLRSLKAKLT